MRKILQCHSVGIPMEVGTIGRCICSRYRRTMGLDKIGRCDYRLLLETSVMTDFEPMTQIYVGYG